MMKLIVFGIMLSGLAQAGWGKNTACKADVERLCKGIEPGEKRIMKCLRENKEALSDECKAFRKEAKGRRAAVHDACKSDIEKFCKNKSKKPAREIGCLKEHQSELLDSCRAEIEKAEN